MTRYKQFLKKLIYIYTREKYYYKNTKCHLSWQTLSLLVTLQANRKSSRQYLLLGQTILVPLLANRATGESTGTEV